MNPLLNDMLHSVAGQNIYFDFIHARAKNDNHKHTVVGTNEDVYFIQDEDSGMIKIGVSEHPELRLRYLKTGNPHALRILGTVASGGYLLERRLHKKFKPHRCSGEWFAPVPELTAWIKKNAKTEKGEAVI
jgi:hypothetical protein